MSPYRDQPACERCAERDRIVAEQEAKWQESVRKFKLWAPWAAMWLVLGGETFARTVASNWSTGWTAGVVAYVLVSLMAFVGWCES